MKNSFLFFLIISNIFFNLSCTNEKEHNEIDDKIIDEFIYNSNNFFSHLAMVYESDKNILDELLSYDSLISSKQP